MIDTSVVFPQPEGPTSISSYPAWTSRRPFAAVARSSPPYGSRTRRKPTSS